MRGVGCFWGEGKGKESEGGDDECVAGEGIVRRREKEGMAETRNVYIDACFVLDTTCMLLEKW